MSEKPTLLVLAAGMGSRYGSLKQLDPVGPCGETIMDYSVYDAARAGFGRVVFVIRKSFAEEFRKTFSRERFGSVIDIDYVYQELDSLPEGFKLPEGREKPWGTNHAVMMASEVINTPFAVINADDFYGSDSYSVIARYLDESAGKPGNYCMVGYRLSNTLSDYGTVSRGECTVNSEGNLVSMVERTSIRREGDRIVYQDGENLFPLDENTPVSMNMFGFKPDYFKKSEEFFTGFLSENIDNPKSEFYIPTMVNHLVSTGGATVRVLDTDSAWFGVTYKEDRPEVMRKIATLVAQGHYPEKLWK